MRRRGPPWRAVVLAGLLLAGGCTALVPRLRPPWIESRLLTLEQEWLEVQLEPGRARVRAVLLLRSCGGAPPLELAFPEDERDPPLERLEVRAGGVALESVRRRRSWLQGALPLGHVTHWHLFVLPEMAPGQAVPLQLSYQQALAGRFRYLMRTGAYFAGPLGRLSVQVVARGVRVRSAELYGQAPRGAAGRLVWQLGPHEPAGDLVLRLGR